MNNTINRRRFAFGLSSLIVGAALAPTRTFAQSQKEDAGKPASASTVKNVEQFIRDFADALNAKDSGVVNQVDSSMYPGFFFAPQGDADRSAMHIANGDIAKVDIFDLRDVRKHESGNLSVEVTYSGFTSVYFYATERWFVKPVNSSYVIVDDVTAPLRVTKGLRVGKMTTTLSLQGLEVKASLPAGTTLIVNSVTNTETQQTLSSSIFRIDQGQSVQEAASQTNNNGLTFIGRTPMPPGQKFTYAFLLPKPGAGTYLIQEFALNGTQEQPIAGDQFAVGLTVPGVSK